MLDIKIDTKRQTQNWITYHGGRDHRGEAGEPGMPPLTRPMIREASLAPPEQFSIVFSQKNVLSFEMKNIHCKNIHSHYGSIFFQKCIFHFAENIKPLVGVCMDRSVWVCITHMRCTQAVLGWILANLPVLSIKNKLKILWSEYHLKWSTEVGWICYRIRIP